MEEVKQDGVFRHGANYVKSMELRTSKIKGACCLSSWSFRTTSMEVLYKI